MKITKVYTEKYKWPKDKPIQNGKTTFTHNSLNLVCIETDEGITGYGTSYELNFVDRLGQLLIGENPLNNEKLWKRMYVPKFLGRKGNSLIGAEEKDLFDKMTTNGMHFYYLPTAILYHIIPATKLTQDYFDRLTHGIGVSERYRTLQISKGKYLNRLFKEAIKWGGTIVLWFSFALRFQFAKGNKLILFRRNVTRGLLSKQKKA